MTIRRARRSWGCDRGMLVLTDPQGVKTGVPVAGTRRMLRERRLLRARRV